MEWWLSLLVLLAPVVTLIMVGVPVAFAFLIVNVIGAMIFLGGIDGFAQILDNATETLTKFTLVPVPLFILMGGIFFNTGLAQKTFRGIDILLGRLPGRLSYLTVAGGTVFSTLTGASMANTAMLGSLMLPEMRRRKYSTSLSMGPILATGGLAIIIPPSAPAVVLGSLAGIDIAQLLIAGIGPGVVLALMFAGVIFLQVRLNPRAAPQYDVPKVPLAEKLYVFVTSVLPMLAILAIVVGTILFGIATPTESAAFGVFAMLLVALLVGEISWKALYKAVESAATVSTMLFFIIVGSLGFSQLVSFSGANQGLLSWLLSFDLAPTMLIVMMLLVLMVMGMFMDLLSMMLLTVPVFFPVAAGLDFNPVLFGIMVLIALEMGLITPPFGLSLFIMKALAPPETTMTDVIRSVIPYIVCDFLILALLMLFPAIALYLPSLIAR